MPARTRPNYAARSVRQPRRWCSPAARSTPPSAQNGTRYADLDNAFAYRDKVSDSCSCNGKDGLGLARVETSGDPTLRPGDIVATNDGLATYHRQEQDRGIHADRHVVERMGAPPCPRSRSAAGAAEREDRAGGQRRHQARRASSPRRRRQGSRTSSRPTARPPRRRATATRSSPAIRSRTDA